MKDTLREFVKAQAELKSLFADENIFNQACKMTIEQYYGKDKVDEIFEKISNYND